jgi:hypothetical protein
VLVYLEPVTLTETGQLPATDPAVH